MDAGQTQEHSLRSAFENYCATGKTTLQVTELEELVTDVVGHHVEGMAKAALEQFDTNGTGAIEFDEFRSLMGRLQTILEERTGAAGSAK